MKIISMYSAVIAISFIFGMAICTEIIADIEIKRINKEWEELHKGETV